MLAGGARADAATQYAGAAGGPDRAALRVPAPRSQIPSGGCPGAEAAGWPAG